MTKKIIVILTGIIIAVLTVSTVSSRKELALMAAELLTLEQENETLLAKNYKAQNTPEETVPYTVSSSEISVEAPVPSADTEEPEGNNSRRMMRNLSKMLDNPAMNKMMAASQRGALDVMYEDLAVQLKLTGEEKEHFMDLLLARQMGLMESGMKMMAGNLTAEEEAALKADIKEKSDLLKEEMEYFLNSEDDVAEWEFYEKTLQDRMMLSQMEESLGDTDAALSDQTYRQLLEAIHDEKIGFDFSSDLGDEENNDMSPERFSAENIKSFAEDIRALNEKISTRVQSILTPEQFEEFMKSLSASTELQISQLEMAGQMFGNK